MYSINIHVFRIVVVVVDSLSCCFLFDGRLLLILLNSSFFMVDLQSKCVHTRARAHTRIYAPGLPAIGYRLRGPVRAVS